VGIGLPLELGLALGWREMSCQHCPFEENGGTNSATELFKLSK
jgi:hypothetical protein